MRVVRTRTHKSHHTSHHTSHKSHRQITASVTFLPLLTEACTFDLLVISHTVSHYITSHQNISHHTLHHILSHITSQRCIRTIWSRCQKHGRSLIQSSLQKVGRYVTLRVTHQTSVHITYHRTHHMTPHMTDKHQEVKLRSFTTKVGHSKQRTAHIIPITTHHTHTSSGAHYRHGCCISHGWGCGWRNLMCCSVWCDVYCVCDECVYVYILLTGSTKLYFCFPHTHCTRCVCVSYHVTQVTRDDSLSKYLSVFSFSSASFSPYM